MRIKQLRIILSIIVVVVVAVSAQMRAGDASTTQTTARGGKAKTTHCKLTKDVAVIKLNRNKYPLTVDHLEDAIRSGESVVLHIDRPGAEANREQSLAGIATKPGYDRDEYPPAVSREGGRGADVRYVPSSDNRGAGSSMGSQLGHYCDGQAFKIVGYNGPSS